MSALSYPPPSHRFELPRERVLKVQADFADIKQNGERFVGRHFIANWRMEPQDAEGDPSIGHSRFAVVAGKKVGGAVERNRYKRLLRESFRLNQHHFSNTVSLVLIARKAMQGKVFEDVNKEFRFFLKKAGLWIA
ncbi:MAG: ribonuclease P protein component [Verrucomicrobia bacterium]|nr:ribonuclease P protein component [Verrucomicrobiota bacterium]